MRESSIIENNCSYQSEGMIESHPSEISASGKGHQWMLKPLMGTVHLNPLIGLGLTQSWAIGHYYLLMQCNVMYTIASPMMYICQKNYIDPELSQSNV